MANNYFNFGTPFIPGTKVRSEQVNTEFGGVESGFDLLPTDPSAMVTGTGWFGADVQGATINEYLITTPDPQSALINGQRVAFFATHTNDGGVTFNVDTLGLVNAVDNDGTALVANDIISGQYYEFVYDNANTQWVRSLAGSDLVIGGADTQIQYNDGGVFGGTAGFTFTKGTLVTALPGDLTVAGLVDGRDVASDGATQDAHIADGTIHFTQAAISVTASQISDFTAAVTAVAVTSVAGGTNVNVTGTATAPIVNLDAAITGTSVNGVTLTAAGVATNFLDETGSYSVPAGAAGGADTEIQINAVGALAGITAGVAGTVLTSNGVGVAPTYQVVAGGGDVTKVGTPVNDQLGVWTGDGTIEGDANLTWDGTELGLTDGRVLLDSSISERPAVRFSATGEGVDEKNWEVMLWDDEFYIRAVDDSWANPAAALQVDRGTGATISGVILGGDADTTEIMAATTITLNSSGTTELSGIVKLSNGSFYLNERAAAQADIAGFGQLWAGTDNSLNFTDEAGTNTVLTAGGSSPWTEASTNLYGGVNAGASITSGLQNFLGGFGAGTAITDGSQNTIIGIGAGSSMISSSDNVGIGNNTLDNAATLLRNTAIGRNAGGSVLNGSNDNIFLGYNSGPTASVVTNRLYIDIATTVTPFIGGDMSTGGVELAGTVRFTERADHIQTPAPTFGELWVRNDTPNALIFTDDAGTDFDLTAGGGTPGGADTQVQFNNAGAFDGDSQFTWDDTAKVLTLENATTDPDSLKFVNTNGFTSTDESKWRMAATVDTFRWDIIDDAEANNYQFMFIDRSGTGAAVQVDNIQWNVEGDFTIVTPNSLIIDGAGNGDNVRVFSDFPEILMEDSGNTNNARITGSFDDSTAFNDRSLDFSLNGSTKLSLKNDGILIDEVLRIEQRAAADTDLATYGQLWVNSADDSLNYTTEAGVNTNLLTVGGGDVTKVGTPVDNQVAVWTGDGTIEGTTDFTFSGTVLTLDGANAKFTIANSLATVSTMTATNERTDANVLRLFKQVANATDAVLVVQNTVNTGNDRDAVGIFIDNEQGDAIEIEADGGGIIFGETQPHHTHGLNQPYGIMYVQSQLTAGLGGDNQPVWENGNNADTRMLGTREDIAIDPPTAASHTLSNRHDDPIRCIVLLESVTVSLLGDIRFRVGDATGGEQTVGYTTRSWATSTAGAVTTNTFTNGYHIEVQSASSTITGRMVMEKTDRTDDHWQVYGTFLEENAGSSFKHEFWGHVDQNDYLDRVIVAAEAGVLGGGTIQALWQV